ncbi:phenylalanine--tRNA ligase subunit beta [Alloacidobacterium sp.]|uniref:phenylalanine--tRNA ligase subunit beta n=1 Tax=Alloacidobacterium sp. TaxID=2951999 RepID=UPI002D5870D5|nr:phenylalanine--tRNA ligase subunit beta [Alloacidobacterium sp.]HYK35622.1 phenylalanine--tRNA ligase subunit beta [Alloacidobacterium sp.]
MKILSSWLRSYLPKLDVTDRQLADDLTLRGIAVEGVFDLSANGSLFEMDITTNRVDAMNHYGIAREAATIYGLKLLDLNPKLPTAKPSTKPYPIKIEEPTLCGRFTARVLRNVKITQSAGIVAECFRLLEQKLISNAVDATNYVTQAMGHPTHAFDLDKLEGGIILRCARKGEKLRTLDGIERTLDSDDLVVADEKKALAIAGVMGGWDTMITPETKNILVEAAWFDPASVRRSSKRHLLHTDASHRFERGADFNAPPVASALVSSIILEAGGEIEGDLVDVMIPEAEQRTARRPAITFAVSEAKRILGATEDSQGITPDMAETILTGLGCRLNKNGTHQTSTAAQDLDPSRAVSVPSGSKADYQVLLPSWRLDLEREIDLIEEIARVYGYNRFQNTLPTFAGAVVELPWAEKESTIRSTLLGLGWTEAVSSTFCSAADAVTFASQPNSAIPLGNPLSEEAGMLRSSLASGMLGMLALNLNRDMEDVMLFELGTVFQGTTDKVEEKPALSIGATGKLPLAGPHQPSRELDFYDVKGTVEALLGKFFAKSLYFDRFPSDSGLMPAWLHPGRSARAAIDGATVGYFGQLHPAEAQRRKIKQTIYIGEIYLDRLYKQTLRQPVVRELSRFQAVRRDFSFILAAATRWEQIAEALTALGIPELQQFEAVEILDEKDSKLVPAGHTSLLLRTVFQAQDRTLQEDELQGYAQRVISAVEALGGKLRS